MSEFNKLFPEILLAYIANVGCELSNARCNELSKYVSGLELRAERAESRLQEYQDDTARVLSEQCPTDERHCGCVPILRKALQEANADAERLVSNWSSFGRDTGWVCECNYCLRFAENKKDIVHKPNCPIELHRKRIEKK